MQHKEKLEYVPPHLKVYGEFQKVVQGGGGKLSPVAKDSGDIRKPKGGE